MTAAAAPAEPVRRTTAHTFLLLTDPAVEWGRRIAMVREARHFVHLLSYYVAGDARGFEMLDALADAQRRGVAVLLGIDAFGQFLGTQLLTPGERAALDQRLAALGPALHWYRAPTRLQRLFGAGQHIKVQASEAGEVLFGSSNISERSFDPAQWREVSFSLWGEAALAAFDMVDQLFPAAVRPAHRALVVEATGGSGAMPLELWWHDPNRSAPALAPLARLHNPLTDRLVESIDAARHSIRAASFYFKPCAALATAFERAARRGVAIEVLHSHREALIESDLPWLAAAVDFGRWFAAGMTIRESLRGEHAKLLLIDDAELAIGCYNFEHAAHDRLAELMVFVRDAEVIRQVGALFDASRADPNTMLMDAAAYAQLPITLRARTRLFWPLRRWF